MATFKVKSGAHRENGQTYRKGDVVESHRPLMQMFPNKFEEIEQRRGRKANEEAELEGQKQPPGDTTKLAGTKVKDIIPPAADPDAEAPGPVDSGATKSEDAKTVTNPEEDESHPEHPVNRRAAGATAKPKKAKSAAGKWQDDD